MVAGERDQLTVLVERLVVLEIDRAADDAIAAKTSAKLGRRSFEAENSSRPLVKLLHTGRAVDVPAVTPAAVANGVAVLVGTQEGDAGETLHRVPLGGGKCPRKPAEQP